jgi:hypothetical protein
MTPNEGRLSPTISETTSSAEQALDYAWKVAMVVHGMTVVE